MTSLRILNVIVWGFMVVFMFKGAMSAVSGKALRRGDLMRLACLTTALIILGFNLRWLFAPDNNEILAALYVLCAADGIFILILARAYGRGPRVQ